MVNGLLTYKETAMTRNNQKDKKWYQSIGWMIIMSFLLLVLPFSIFVRYVIIKQSIDGGGWIVLLIIIALFVYISLLEKNYKYTLNRYTYKLKLNIVEHDRKITIYSVLILGSLIGVYESMREIGDSYPLLPLLLERRDYYAIVISICSLVVALFLSLKLDPKQIESGVDFISALMIHAKNLQRKGTTDKKEVLHIYSPNINLGVADIIQNKREHSIMYDIIPKCNHVSFVFHCRYYSSNLKESLQKIKSYDELSEKANGDEMLKFLKDYFKSDIHGNIDELTRKCVTDLLEILNFENMTIKPAPEIQENMVGFRSRYEMALGQYTDIDRSRGKVDFNGEVVTIPEFIEFIPKINKWD